MANKHSNSEWSLDDIPDQTGRVAIITGASSGIGLEAARALAARGAQTVLAVRDTVKGERAMRSIRDAYPQAKVHVIPLELADQQSIQRFADSFVQNYSRLDLLINNAGVMMCPHSETRDGFEVQFGTNHLGHYALTGKLLPLLQRTAHSRVVVVSSLAHRGGKLNFDDLNWQQREYDTGQAYSDSKEANVLFALGLAERLRASDNQPLVTLAHPGWTQTDLQRHSWKYRFLGRFLAQPTAAGALPTLRAAIDDQAQPGDFYGPRDRKETQGPPVRVEISDQAKDPQQIERLWAASAVMTGVNYEGLTAG